MIGQSKYLNTVGVLSAAGEDLHSLKQGLRSKEDFLSYSETYGHMALPLGLCDMDLPSIPFSEPFWHSRNNQFALCVYQQIEAYVTQVVRDFGRERVGVVIGTSTSGIADTERAVRQAVLEGCPPSSYHYSVQEMGNTASFIGKVAGVSGPVYGVSTACSSGAKAIISAQRLIDAGLCDAVIAGGVDTLCQLTIQGFSSLEAVSSKVCNPFSENRDGINIGEAGALFVVSKRAEGVKLSGVGESSDAHHISAPQPDGEGAVQSMSEALKNAQLTPEKIEYINLHGTATRLNDQMEARAVNQLFGHNVLCSSTKPLTGHTLGAAGALEAAIAWLMLTDEAGFVPEQRWDGQYDQSLPPILLVNSQHANTKVNSVLSNSFAFGGNNVSLILERL